MDVTARRKLELEWRALIDVVDFTSSIVSMKSIPWNLTNKAINGDWCWLEGRSVVSLLVSEHGLHLWFSVLLLLSQNIVLDDCPSPCTPAWLSEDIFCPAAWRSWCWSRQARGPGPAPWWSSCWLGNLELFPTSKQWRGLTCPALQLTVSRPWNGMEDWLRACLLI